MRHKIILKGALSILIMLLIFQSCTQDDLDLQQVREQQEQALNLEQQSLQDINGLQNINIGNGGYRRFENIISVGPNGRTIDLFLELEELVDCDDEGEIPQNGFGPCVNRKRNIWEGPFIDALKDWNNFGLCLVFRETGDSSEADIIIKAGNPPFDFGVAQGPSDNNPGEVIVIKIGNDKLSDLVQTEARKNLLVHEIGHTIGFRHTGTNEGLPIIGACPPQGSVMTMQSTVSQMASQGITATDIQALRALYPLCSGGANCLADIPDGPISNPCINPSTTSISGPGSLTTNNVGLYHLPGSHSSALNGDWTVLSYQFPNAMQHFQVVLDNDFNFGIAPRSSAPEGQYTIQLKVTGNNCDRVIFEKTIAVSDGPDIILFD